MLGGSRDIHSKIVILRGGITSCKQFIQKYEGNIKVCNDYNEMMERSMEELKELESRYFLS